MRNKRGQFYLIGAVIIIMVIIGFFVVGNYAKKEEQNIKIYDVAEELKVETGSVYDYGIYNPLVLPLPELVEDWTEKYYTYSSLGGNVEDWVFVYGNEAHMDAIFFTMASAGSVSINTGGSTDTKIEIIKPQKKKKEDIGGVTDDKVSVKFKNFTHEFKLKSGENFYFVIKKGGYVARD